MELSIQRNWRDYFTDYYEGLGTTYERFILHRYFERIKDTYSISSVLEVPSFGMTGISGINSMWWAGHGVPVTVVDDNEDRISLISRVWREVSLEVDLLFRLKYAPFLFPDQSFDLCWNFASLWFVPDLRAFLKELARVARKVIFICVPNRRNVGYLLRSLFSRNTELDARLANVDPGRIKEVMLESNWVTAGDGFLDVPPWPDIPLKKEEMLRRIGLGVMAAKLERKAGEGSSIIDYFKGIRSDMEKDVLRFGLLEESPLLFKRVWAHHRYLLFRKAE